MEHSAACGIMVLVGRRLFHTFRLKLTLLPYLSSEHIAGVAGKTLLALQCVCTAHFLERVAVARTACTARTF